MSINNPLPQLTLYFLGEPEIVWGSQRLFFGDSHAQVLALVAYLSCQAKPTPLSDVLSLLGGVSTTNTASLQPPLCLEPLLERGLLSKADEGLKMVPNLWYDVYAFRQIALNEAVSSFDLVVQAQINLFELYVGPFLRDIVVPYWPRLQNWLETERRNLAQIYTCTLQAIISTYRQSNNWPQVLALSRQALAQGEGIPQPGWLHRHYMEALARLGQAKAAVTHYQSLLKTSPKPPEAETQALYKRISQGQVLRFSF